MNDSCRQSNIRNIIAERMQVETLINGVYLNQSNA
jgi:hypothetical protein